MSKYFNRFDTDEAYAENVISGKLYIPSISYIAKNGNVYFNPVEKDPKNVVDMGLSVKWTTSNVGTFNDPYVPGLYMTWSETGAGVSPDILYDWKMVEELKIKTPEQLEELKKKNPKEYKELIDYGRTDSSFFSWEYDLDTSTSGKKEEVKEEVKEEEKEEEKDSSKDESKDTSLPGSGFITNVKGNSRKYDMHINLTNNVTKSILKYCTDAKYWAGKDIPDKKTETDFPQDDFATIWQSALCQREPAKYDNRWYRYRTPTEVEFKELVENCDMVWDEHKKGVWFVSKKNGNSIFMFACGLGEYGENNKSSHGVLDYGYYWSKNLNTENPSKAISLHISKNVKEIAIESVERCMGCNIRAVYDDKLTPFDIKKKKIFDWILTKDSSNEKEQAKI